MARKDQQSHVEVERSTSLRRKGGHAGRYDDWTVFDLKLRAKELGLQGYSDKSRAQLIDMVRHH